MNTPLNISGTRQYAAVRIRRYLLHWPALTAYVVILVAGLLLGFDQNSLLLPFLIIIALSMYLHVLCMYLREELENDALPLSIDATPADYLSYAIIAHLDGRTQIGGGDLLQVAVSTPRGTFLLEEMGIQKEALLVRCMQKTDTSIDITPFLLYAKSRLSEMNETRIDATVIIRLLFEHVDCCKALLAEADISEEDLEGITFWERFHHHFRASEPFWTPDAIQRNSAMGRSWVIGYTDALDQLTMEACSTEHVCGEESIIAHRDIIEQILRVLSRGKQKNVVLTGEVGTGKRTLIGNMAIALRTRERSMHQTYTRVLMLQTEKLLSGVGNPDTFLLNALARAQSSGHFILVIRDLTLLLRTENMNLKAIVHKCLEAKNISVIGIVDVREYHSLIKIDPILDSQFERISVEDTDDTDTMTILMAHLFSRESKGIRMTYRALRSVIDLSKRYLTASGGFPGKGIDVMDDAVARACELGHRHVTEEHIREVISLRSKVNIQKISGDDRARLLRLETVMREKIIDQDVAVKAVTGALKRAKLDLSERKRPIGTFLFLGPTGVGKTQTAKVLAQEYFDSEDAIIRLDMNEFSHADSVFGIIGSTNDGEGFLSQKIHDKPFSLILLDEIEKAHPNVLNLFLQILDEGFLHDSRGLKTDFRNTIIIATSNAGALFMRDYLKEHTEEDRTKLKTILLDTIIREKVFSPEFLNRFDDTIVFYPLSHTGATKVAELMIGDIVNDVQKRRGITVRVAEEYVHDLVERGYSMEFGAREMRRTITEMIEDYLAEYLLNHDVKRGEEILIKQEETQN